MLAYEFLALNYSSALKLGEKLKSSDFPSSSVREKREFIAKFYEGVVL